MLHFWRIMAAHVLGPSTIRMVEEKDNIHMFWDQFSYFCQRYRGERRVKSVFFLWRIGYYKYSCISLITGIPMSRVSLPTYQRSEKIQISHWSVLKQIPRSRFFTPEWLKTELPCGLAVTKREEPPRPMSSATPHIGREELIHQVHTGLLAYISKLRVDKHKNEATTITAERNLQSEKRLLASHVIDSNMLKILDSSTYTCSMQRHNKNKDYDVCCINKA